MKKEFGKWLLDVAKYIFTAVVCSTLFSTIENKAIVCIIGFCAVLMILGIGISLINK
jgi:hypothetical protein